MIRKLILMMALIAGVISASAALPFDKYSINRRWLILYMHRLKYPKEI